MSRFLAPIHTWLFNKIKTSEALEHGILEAFALQEDPEVREIYETYGPSLPELPIESLIDPGNIHGWLQDRIHRTEGRLASLITVLTRRDPENIRKLELLFTRQGARMAADAGLEGAVAPESAFKKIHDIILEGMPCDHVSAVLENSADRIVWGTTQCLHQRYYDAVGGDVSQYYTLRGALIGGLLSGTRPSLTYTRETAADTPQFRYYNTLTIQ